MSRTFDGQLTQPAVVFAPGVAPNDQGAITVMALFRFAASASGAFGVIVTGQDSSNNDIWALDAFNLVLFAAHDFTSGSSALTTGDWYWGGFSHDSGGIPTWHIRNYSTGGTWSHTAASGTVGDGTGPLDHIVVGNSGLSGGNGFRGDVAVVAVLGETLTDLEVEARFTSSAADISPDWGTLWNQASTADNVSDFTGGGGDQTAISATSVGVDDPPGFDYSLAGPSGPTVTVWDGAAEVSATVTVWDGSAEQPASVTEIAA